MDRYVDAGGVRVRYRERAGTGAGLPLVLVHGITESLEFWGAQLEGGVGGRRVLALDLPGHGLSGAAAAAAGGACGTDALARALLSFADALGLGGFVGVGNSFGCAVLIQAAALAPHRVAAAVLASPALVGLRIPLAFRAAAAPLLGELVARLAPSALIAAEQLRAVVRDPGAITPEVRAAAGRNFSPPRGMGAYLGMLRVAHTPFGVTQGAIEEHVRLLQGMDMPVLLVHGRDDAVLPVQQTIDLHKVVPNASLKIFDDCGHTPQLEKVEEFNALVVDFLPA